MDINLFMALMLSVSRKKVVYPAPGQDSAAQLLSQEAAPHNIFLRFDPVAILISQNSFTELVQSTLLWNYEPGNFPKKEIVSVAFPLLQTNKFACCKQTRVTTLWRHSQLSSSFILVLLGLLW